MSSGGGDDVNLWKLSFDHDQPLLKYLNTIHGPDNGRWIDSLAISPSGKFIAFSGYPENGHQDSVELTIYDAEQQNIVHSIRKEQGGHSHNISSLDFSGDGNLLISGGWDNQVKLWNTIDWTWAATFREHTDIVRDVGFLADGKTAVSTGYDGRIIKWDCEKKIKLTADFFNPRWDIDSLCIAGDDAFLATTVNLRFNDVVAGVLTAGGGEQMGTATLVQLRDTTDLSELVPKRKIAERSFIEYRYKGTRISCFDFSSNSAQIIVGTQNGDTYLEAVFPDPDILSSLGQIDGNKLLRLTGSTNSVSFAKSDEAIEAVSEGQFCRIVLAENQSHYHRDESTFVLSTESAKDGSCVQTHFGGIKFCDRYGKFHRLVEDLSSAPLASTFSSNGKYFVRVNNGGEIECFSLEQARSVHRFQTMNSGDVTCIMISNDGNFLATGHHDGRVLVFDARAQNLIHNLHRHVHSVNSIAFSPDSKRIATGSEDASVRIWEIESDLSLLHLKNHEGPVGLVKFSPDGRRLAVASYIRYSDDVGTLRIWQTADLSNLSHRKKLR